MKTSKLKDIAGSVGIVMTVLILIVLIPVAAFVAFTVMDEFSAITDNEEQLFTVTDASVDQYCILDNYPLQVDSVTHYNGTAWSAVPSANWSNVGRNVTVQSGGIDNGGGAGNTTTQINVTYDLHASGQIADTRTTSDTVFNLLLVLVIVIVAAALIATIYVTFTRMTPGRGNM